MSLGTVASVVGIAAGASTLLGGGGGGGGGSSGGGSSSQMGGTIYDPFASQRGQYQGQLSGMLPGMLSAYSNLSAPNIPSTISNLYDPSKMASDPTYQFELQQGLNATQASGAARGIGNSGAQQLALQAQGMGIADVYAQQQQQNAFELMKLQQSQQGLSIQEQGMQLQTANLGESWASLIGQFAGAGNSAIQSSYGANQSAGLGALFQSAGGFQGIGNSLSNLYNGYSGASLSTDPNSYLSPGDVQQNITTENVPLYTGG